VLIPPAAGELNREENNMKIMILLLSGFSLVGCCCSQTGESQGPPVSEINKNSSSEMVIRYETPFETLTRVQAESKTSQDIADGRAIEEWYGKTLWDLGVVRNVTVPHRGDGLRSGDFDVTKSHILAALDNYTLVDYDSFSSSTHIPVGVSIKIEYQNGIVGWVNFCGGVPWTVALAKNNITGKYGLEGISEQENPPDKK